MRKRFYRSGNRRVIEGLIVALCGWGSAVTAPAVDHLEGDGKLRWSPDGRWIAFNWPYRDELYVVGTESAEAYLLRPMGDAVVDNGVVVADRATATNVQQPQDRILKIVASPGRERLVLAAWSPTGQEAVVRCQSNTLAVFSLANGTIRRQLTGPESALVADSREVRVEFQFLPGQAGKSGSYQMRAVSRDGKVLKEVLYTDPQEVGEMAVLRFRDISFLSQDHQFLLRPTRSEQGWLLVREALSGAEAPRALTILSPLPPVQWKLDPSGQWLAITEPAKLIIGRLSAWEAAREHPLSGTSAAIEWSPDGSALAFLNQEHLSVFAPPDAERPVQVSSVCALRFWGWRGRALIFGDAEKGMANLYRVTLDRLDKVEPIVRVPSFWEMAPSAEAVSPDGSKLACLVSHIDDSGHTIWQLWQIRLASSVPVAEWQQLFSFRDEPQVLR